MIHCIERCQQVQQPDQHHTFHHLVHIAHRYALATVLIQCCAHFISGLEDLFKFIFSQLGNELTRDYLLAAIGERNIRLEIGL